MASSFEPIVPIVYGALCIVVPFMALVVGSFGVSKVNSNPCNCMITLDQCIGDFTGGKEVGNLDRIRNLCIQHGVGSDTTVFVEYTPYQEELRHFNALYIVTPTTIILACNAALYLGILIVWIKQETEQIGVRSFFCGTCDRLKNRLKRRHENPDDSVVGIDLTPLEEGDVIL